MREAHIGGGRLAISGVESSFNAAVQILKLSMLITTREP